MKKPSLFRFRFWILALFFGTWLLLIPARIFFFIGPARTATILKGEELARQSGLVPAIRGRIITQDGHILAWNERFFDLQKTMDLSERTRLFLEAVLRQKINADDPVVYRGLSADEFTQIRKQLRKYPELKIVPRVERRYITDARLHDFIGKCEWKNNRLTGVSGLEKQYDAALAGESGQYEVMLDRYRHWISRSLRFLRKPRHGSDLYLKQNLAELFAPGGSL